MYVHDFAELFFSLLQLILSFCLQWNSSVHLKRTSSGFEGSVQVPWATKVLYKFRVDGYWTPHEDQPTEYDEHGNVNNVTYTPDKPVVPETPASPPPAPVEELPAPTPVEELPAPAPAPVDPTPEPEPEPKKEEPVAAPVTEEVSRLSCRLSGACN